MNVQIRINYDNEELYCVYCKCRINIGEKFIIIEEDNYDEIIEKEYHPLCLPEMEEEE